MCDGHGKCQILRTLPCFCVNPWLPVFVKLQSKPSWLPIYFASVHNFLRATFRHFLNDMRGPIYRPPYLQSKYESRKLKCCHPMPTLSCMNPVCPSGLLHVPNRSLVVSIFNAIRHFYVIFNYFTFLPCFHVENHLFNFAFFYSVVFFVGGFSSANDFRPMRWGVWDSFSVIEYLLINVLWKMLSKCRRQ